MKSNTDQSFIAQFPRNLIANVAWFIISVIISILLVPYFVSTLGVAAYGLIPLATSVTGYVAIVILSLNTAVGRFLTVDLQKEDYDAANRTFNTALFGLTAIMLLMGPFVLVIAYFIPVLFNVPVGQETAATLLFLGVCIALFIRAWSGNFTVQLFAYNRLDLQNLVNIIGLLIQTSLIVFFFIYLGPDLVLVGEAYFVGAIVASAVSIILAKRVCPYLSVSIRSIDRTRITDLFRMGWWVVINDIGSLLFLQIDLIVVNLLFGATQAGEYAIALQWVILLRGIAGVLSSLLTPMVLTFYAKGQTDNLIGVTKSAVKLMGIALALPVGIICGFAPQLLTVWVGPQYADLAPLMIILTLHLAINLAVLPLSSIYIAYNQMRFPGTMTLLMGIGNLALAVGLGLLSGWGYFGVAVAGAIVLTVKNVIFTPWYAARIVGISSYTFTRPMITGITIALLTSAAIIGITNLFTISTLIPLIFAIIVVSLVYLAAAWVFGLNTFERELFLSYLPEPLRRLKT